MTAVAGPMRTRVLAVLVVAVISISLAAIFIRLADAPGVVVAFYRMLLASLALVPWSLRGIRRTPPRGRALVLAIIAGLLLGGHFGTWISSLSFTIVAASVALVATIPIWVALFSWLFLGLTPSLGVLFGVLLAVAGGSIIAFGDLRDGNASLFGDGLALAGALFAAGYLLLGRSAQRLGLSLGAYVGIAYGVAALVLLPLPALLGFSYSSYSLDTFGWILLLALIPQLVGHTGINYAMKHLPPTFVATAALLEPVGAGIFAFVLFTELPSLLTLFGTVLLVLGVAITTRSSQLRGE